MRRRLATIAAALLVTAAAAQGPLELAGWFAGPRIITGGFRVSLAPAAVVEVSVEQPIYRTSEAWRVGAVLSIRARTDFHTGSVEALAGVTATFPVGPAAVQAQLLWREVYAAGASREGAPELAVSFATGF